MEDEKEGGGRARESGTKGVRSRDERRFEKRWDQVSRLNAGISR